MPLKKIMLIFGTRPEAIKMIPVIKSLQQEKDFFQINICVTGQHREMLDQVLNIFDIIPEYDLNIMQKGQDLYSITTKILLGLRDIFQQERPDLVLVHGDTTTSTAAALAAFYQKIPVGHVEAGLRTHNIYSPWPEEMNRAITGRLATFHFAPTTLSKNNLLHENVAPEKICITGNTVIDTLHYALEKLNGSITLLKSIKQEILSAGYDTARLSAEKKMILITGHRRENFGEGFMEICLAIKELNSRYPDVDFIYPMHLNPNVRKPIAEIFGSTPPENMFFIEPLDYLPFVFMMKKSYLVLTDSGGIQEEAPGLGKPVLVMRDTTERPEAIDAGTVKLVGASYDNICRETSILLDNAKAYNAMSNAVNPYGDGSAGRRIADYLKNNISLI